MKKLDEIFKNNRKWADRISGSDPEFFSRLSKGQSPEILLIGCSDSRVPPSQITGLIPGDLFVHRNIANLVIPSDISCLSVLQYAVDVLKVKHIVVCGHYDCGGVKGSIDNHPHGLVDNWLQHIRDLYKKNEQDLQTIKDEQERINRLCELNVIEQVRNIRNNTIVQGAWQRGQSLAVHGWIYSVAEGLLRDMDISITSFHG